MRAPRSILCRGFTLLEVLVALSILALSYGVILQIFGGAARNAALAGDYRRALIIAESQLDYAAASVASDEIADSGVTHGKFHWQVSQRPAEEYLADGLVAGYIPVTIGVRVSWGNVARRERTVNVSTVRLIRGGAR